MNEGINIMKTMNEWFPISSVSKNVNIPRETLRRYARQYGDYLVIKRGEKQAYLIHESSFSIIKRIRHLLEQGHQHEQVKAILDKTDGLKVETNDEKTNEQMLDQPQSYKEMKEEIQTVVEQNKKLMELLDDMHERMSSYEELLLQQQQIAFTNEQIHEQVKEGRDYERKQDEYLMKAMNDLHEKRRGIAGTKEKKGIFTKIFKI